MTALQHETAQQARVDADAERLSTAPQPAPPPARGQRAHPFRQAWRQLTSMRTALLLLFLLALASVPGGFIPQRSLNPVEVQKYVTDHPSLAPVLDALSLFDVFAAPWFAAIYLLLFISLVGCLVPRIRLHARALRTKPPQLPRSLARLPASDRWETDAEPAEALAAARTVLKRWRTVERPGGVSAEKGYLRESGNLLFHVSLVVLLVGIALGALYGFKATVLVKDGDGFANTVLAYDDINPGRRFSPDRLEPFDLTLREFKATYAEDGKALTFDAHVEWSAGPGEPRQDYDIRVNHPLAVGDAKVYLIGHGYAPRVVVRDRAGNELRQTVPCLPQDAKFVSSCTIKVPNALNADGSPDQLGFEGVFTPTTAQDPQTGRVTSVFPAADNPALTVVGFRGDLGLDVGETQSVYSLDKTDLTQIDAPPQGLRPGDTWQLPGGGSLTYESTAEWATFQVTQDPGKGLALVASCGMVLGLLLSLFVRRRRVWVRVTGPAGGTAAAGPTVIHAGSAPAPTGGTLIEVGGLARTDHEAFATEFAALTGRLREAAGSRPVASTPAGPAPARSEHPTGATAGG
ncbi:MAG TPA: cytochrome c biogenesis protein ResB [Mycobacteriales bacterium]|jgi:cytochrome c biogenesis protein|nr:cytochrome c biogenesis protein ResB [Mycobacteriales bacterium]